MAITFDLFGVQVFYLIIGTSKKIDPQLHISTYPLNEPIYHSVIFVFEGFVVSFLIIFFIVF